MSDMLFLIAICVYTQIAAIEAQMLLSGAYI